MKVHSENMERTLESLIKKFSNPQEGDILISPPGIIETCGVYIGRICAEFLNGHWCWQAYSRDTEYFSSVAELESAYDMDCWYDDGEVM